jgi:hypothetical protein
MYVADMCLNTQELTVLYLHILLVCKIFVIILSLM